MAVLSKLLRSITNNGNNGVMFYCPGCKQQHSIYYEGKNVPIWGWNKDVVKPTFTPSILVNGHREITDEEVERIMNGEDLSKETETICHSFITNGKIQFLNDSNHGLKGQIVNLPEWTDLYD